jgi:hypothetical protein
MKTHIHYLHREGLWRCSASARASGGAVYGVGHGRTCRIAWAACHRNLKNQRRQMESEGLSLFYRGL